MEALQKEGNNTKQQSYDFCRHIKQHYYNSYILNLNATTINQDEKNKDKKLNLPNFFDLKNSMTSRKSLLASQVDTFFDKFFIKNISLNWMALYNPQNISLNSINRDGCIFTISFDETGNYLASSNHIHNIEIWDLKERKVKKVISDHKEIVTGIEFLNTKNSCSNFKRKDSFLIDHLKSSEENINLNPFQFQSKNFLANNEEINYNNYLETLTNESHSEINDEQNKNLNEIDEEMKTGDYQENEHFNDQNVYMMSCSLDKTIKLWKDFNCVHTFLDHNDWVRCLSISNDNKYFLSGCVSSVIKYWDLHQQKVLYTFNNSNDNPDLLNTVNSLNFMSNNPNVFMTGLRSGAVKIFDVRKPDKLVREFRAHKCKLNSVKFNKDDKYLLSSGRDSVARLWDFRNLPSSDNTDTNVGYAVNEYKGHKCQGYNIDCNFFCNENYIITGSEDSNIYIYDTISSELVVKYKTHQKCVNLVKPSPNNIPYSFAYTGLEDMSIYLWDVAKNVSKFIDRNYCAKRNDVEEEFDQGNEYNEYIENQDKDSTQQMYVKLIEEIMSECGDMILRIFHSNNLTYSNGMNFENLLDIIHRKNDQESIKIINMLNEKFMKRICESWMNDSRTGSSESKAKSDSKSSTKVKRNPLALKSKIQCLICSQKKKTLIANKKIKNQINSETQDYEEDIYGLGNNIMYEYEEEDICRRNNLNFYDHSNYYKYNNNDIKEILNFPNVNDSFSVLDSNQNANNKNPSNILNSDLSKNATTNYNLNSNLINLDLIQNNLSVDANRELNLKKNNIKVKTLYSNEDISIKYNYILKKLI